MEQPLFDRDSKLFDPAEIEKCLNCGKPRCNNCLAEKRVEKETTARFILEADKIAEMYNEGRTIRYISERMGVHFDTIRKRMKQYGLGFAGDRPTLTYAWFLALPEEQRRCLTWKGERLA
jgi:hypothetical protein